MDPFRRFRQLSSKNIDDEDLSSGSKDDGAASSGSENDWLLALLDEFPDKEEQIHSLRDQLDQLDRDFDEKKKRSTSSAKEPSATTSKDAWGSMWLCCV